jgi:tRNA-dihydrouridine synthase B
MAGFSDRAMRLVCREHGAEYTVTEMVSAKAVTYGDKKTAAIARIKEDEGPVALQLFGSEPDVFAKATEIMAGGVHGYIPPVAIDINMGCPVNKIFSNGEGSALMRDPDLIYRIVRATVGATDLPVTVKLRAGVDRDHINAIECALAAEAGGASAITLHGRTRVELYSGRADRQLIADVKKSLHIPLIANGDVTSAEEALDMLRTTGADAIMIGRGAIGNPFVFAEISAALSGGTYTPPSIRERAECALRELSLAIEDKGERIAIPEARGRIALYIRAFRGAAQIRAVVNRATTYSEVADVFHQAIENN